MSGTDSTRRPTPSGIVNPRYLALASEYRPAVRELVAELVHTAPASSVDARALVGVAGALTNPIAAPHLGPFLTSAEVTMVEDAIVLMALGLVSQQQRLAGAGSGP